MKVSKSKLYMIVSLIFAVSGLFTAMLIRSNSCQLETACVFDETAVFEEYEDASAHTGETPYNWYCKHTKNGEKPTLDPQMSFIEKYDGYFLDKKTEEKVIYLTFDAGYENGNIKRILDVMKEKNVTGAFFVLEHLIKSSPELVIQMHDDGHLICNHTANHKDMTMNVDREAFEKELSELETVLKEQLGFDMAPYYRPPEGKFNENNLMWAKQAGYSTVFWSFAYADWDNENQPSREEAFKKIIDSTHSGEVILLHPTSSTNADILGELIDKWRADGYSFGTLDRLCGRE